MGKYARDPDYGKPPNWSKLYREHCPQRTDPWSRHAKIIASDILRNTRSPVRRLLIDAGYEPDHWAESIEVTVKNLWETRVHVEYHELPSVGGKMRGEWTPRSRTITKDQVEEAHVAMLVALVEHGVPADMQEALTHGDGRGTLAPGALRKAALAAARAFGLRVE